MHNTNIITVTLALCLFLTLISVVGIANIFEGPEVKYDLEYN